jgi:hypothetical protein
MTIEIRLLEQESEQLVNTQYGPLAALSAHYQRKQVLEPLKTVAINMKTVVYRPIDKLQQVLLSILGGCKYLSEVNTRLVPDRELAKVWQHERFADQSTLARTLDGLTLMHIDQLRTAVTTIWQQHGHTLAHDWRGFLWLDFDLSGLPCGKSAEASTKGYFSGKKTSPDASWRERVSSNTGKRSGLLSFQATVIPSSVSSQQCWEPKML